MNIGVLALQGDVQEHIQSLSDCGVVAVTVKTAQELEGVDALVIPGGESTTIAKLARSILLANKLEDSAIGQETFGGIDMTVRRNAFGRQVDSFETDLKFKGITEPSIRAVFIRAPWVESVGKDVEVLAQVIDESGKSHPVAVRQGKVLATSFHPELTGDNRVHKYFVEEICRELVKR
jgi:5'-phosphate synthase pdxT subunit